MVFNILKLYGRLAIKIYCRKIVLNKPHYLQAKGPLLFAANHPNSFLDGMILTTLLENDLYTLARGDAFANKHFEKLLRWLRLLPVYRSAEGAENLTHNYTTFASCQKIFKKNGIVMIFSEGGSFNEWHLRPLRKGTARLAISSWQKGMDLTVVPVGFNYSTFRNFGKNVYINFGKPLNKQIVLEHLSDGKQFFYFNKQLKEQLQQLVYEIDDNDRNALKEKLYVHQPLWKKILLVLPALLGWLLHAPLYYTAKLITNHYFDNDHYDSVMVALLAVTYPFYWLALTVLTYSLLGWLCALLLLVLLPFCAWATVQLKNQLD